MNENLIQTSSIETVKQYVKEWKDSGATIGLVPTMGFLHEGHASLIARAVEENDYVIVSDFVNPIQFGPTEDLETYPRDFEADCHLVAQMGASLIFHPTPEEMYGKDFFTHSYVDEMSQKRCGESRPIHFQGVCTVCMKLFHISEANRAYFGQKDAQQLAIIRRMVRDLNLNIEIVGCPIIREEDGLAKSSRNTYLKTKQEREAALILHHALTKALEMYEDGERRASVILEAMTQLIMTEPLATIDYIQAVAWDSLQDIEVIEEPVLIAMAVKVGPVRLIDNMILDRA